MDPCGTPPWIFDPKGVIHASTTFVAVIVGTRANARITAKLPSEKQAPYPRYEIAIPTVGAVTPREMSKNAMKFPTAWPRCSLRIRRVASTPIEGKIREKPIPVSVAPMNATSGFGLHHSMTCPTASIANDPTATATPPNLSGQ